MKRTQIEAALAASNPLSDRAAAALPLREAELELLQRITETPVRARRPHTGASAFRRRRLVLVFAAAIAAVAAVLALLPSGERGGGPAPAFAAPLVRFANASPLVLLKLSRWHVVYADEEPGRYGEMHFVRGPADANGNPRGASYHDEASLAGRIASLTWQPASAAEHKWIAGGHERARTGLGVTARRFVGEARGHNWLDISAYLIYRGRELHHRATVSNMAMFYAQLRALSGNRARAAGHTATVRRAIAVMATAPRWPTLREMSRQGAWPQVLIGYAKAMPRGNWYGRPLANEVNSGLGCSALGVHLGR
jgi:hypothetical protein